jgi:hypothetical protein
VSNVSSSAENASTILVTFTVNNIGSAQGTPSCVISAPNLTTENVPMKSIKSGNTEIVPGYPFEVPSGQTHQTQIKVTCSTHAQPRSQRSGKPKYEVGPISVSPLGNTILLVTFRLTNTGATAGTPICQASFKGSALQRIDLKAFGSLYSAALNPGITDFVKNASIVVSEAKSANASDVKIVCH